MADQRTEEELLWANENAQKTITESLRREQAARSQRADEENRHQGAAPADKPVPRDRPSPQEDHEVFNENAQAASEPDLEEPDNFERVPVRRAGIGLPPNLSERARQRQENANLNLDLTERDLDDVTGPALTAEVADYVHLNKMPDNDSISESNSFYAKIYWNGSAYEWNAVTPEGSEWSASKSSSVVAPEGDNTQTAARHETGITGLPDGLLVRMFRQADEYVFRVAVENHHPRNVLETSHGTGSSDTGDWLIDGATGGAGVIVPMLSNISYDDTAHSFVGTFRSLQFDSTGHLVSVSSGEDYTVKALQSVTVVVDNQVDGANSLLEHKKHTLYAFEYDDDAGFTDYHTGIDCT